MTRGTELDMSDTQGALEVGRLEKNNCLNDRILHPVYIIMQIIAKKNIYYSGARRA